MADWVQNAAKGFKTPGQPWVLDAVKDLEKNRILKTSVDNALQQNPDTSALTQSSAKKLDIPLGFATEKSDEINNIAKQKDILSKLKNTETLKKAFENPDFAAIAHDDIDALSKTETSLKVLKSLPYAQTAMAISDLSQVGFTGMLKGLGVGFVQGAEKARQGIRMQWADFIGSERMRLDAERKYAQAELETDLADPNLLTPTGRGVYGGISSLTKQAPAVAAAVAAKSPSLVLGSMFQQVEAEAYGKYRTRGGEPVESFIGAMGEGAVEVATELMPMSYFVNKFGKETATDMLMGMMAREIPGEQIATLAQDAIDTAIANPDKTWGEYFEERPEAAYETLIATVVQTGIMGGVGARPSTYAGEMNKAEKAFTDQENLAQAAESVNETKLKTRSPEDLKTFLEGTLGVEEEVFLSNEDAETFFQSEILETLPEEMADEINQSILTGEDVAIKKTDYLTYLSDHHEELSESLRNDMDGMNAREANEWVEQGSEQFEKEAERILTEMDLENEFIESADRVASNIKDQLVNNSNFRPDVAEKYSQLHKAFAVVAGEKMGVTPEEVYEKFGLRIGQPVAGESLSQDEIDLEFPITNSGGVINQIEEGGTFDGVFGKAGDTSNFGLSKENQQTTFYPRKGKVMGEGDLDVDYDAAIAFLKKEYPDANEEQIDNFYSVIMEDKNVFAMDVNPFKDRGYEDLGEASWEGQRLRGKFAVSQGYDAVAMSDESGVSYLIPYGSKAKVKAELLRQENKAQIQFQDNQALITLLEGADLSSFLHESGHFFFEAYKNLAAESPEIAKDMNALLNFIDVPDLKTWNNMTLGERREGHEKVARSFEAYLFEGKSPNDEMQSLFQRFRDWLLEVYKNLRNLNVELTDEVRGVFDRMLATKEQIREKEVMSAYQPMFESQEESGMTDKKWKEYQSMDERQRAVAEGELQTRSLRDMKWLSNAKSKALKALQSEARAKRKAMKAEVATEVSNEPVYQAMDYLKTHKPKKKKSPQVDSLFLHIKKMGGIDVSKDEGLAQILKPYNKESVPGGFGLPGIAQIGKGVTVSAAAESATEEGYIQLDEKGNVDENALLDILINENAGIDTYTPEGQELLTQFELTGGEDDALAHEINAALGLDYTSGEHLVSDLQNAEKKKDRIERVTDQRMLEKYGDLNNPVNQERAAEEAVHNEAHTRFLHTELTNLTKRTAAGNVLSRAAKSYAQQVIDKKKVRDIRPFQYSQAENRAAKNAEKSLIKGDRESAAEHKRAQVLNNHFFRAANNALKDIEKTIRYFKKFSTKGTRGNIDIEYMDQIDNFLEAYEFKQVSLKELDRRESFRDWYESQELMGFEPVADESLLNQKKNYKNMTYEELRGLRDSIKNIEHLGRLKKKLLNEREKREFNELMDAARQSIEDNARKTVKERGTPTDLAGRMGSWWRGLGAIHRKFASIVREMDGLQFGILYDILTRGMSEAGDKETSMTMVDASAINDLFDPVMGDITKGGLPFNIYSKKNVIPGTNFSMTKENVLMFAMNWGNLGNRQRLLDGGMTGEKSITFDEAQAILDTLSKKEMDFVQGVLDYIATKRPLVAAQERKLTGVEPEWIEAEPIVTKHGTWPGGYFPAKYDAVLSTRSESLDAASDLRLAMKGAFNASSTRSGHTKKRAEEVKGRPILLSFNTISQHLSEVNHRLAFQEWITDANRILKALDEPIRKHYGPELLKELRDTVSDIAVGDAPAKNEFETAVNRFRVGATIVGLGWRFTTALIQPSGLANSWARVGSRHIYKGVKKYMKNPLEAGRLADEESEMMRGRSISMQREVNEVLNTIRAGDKMSKFKVSMFYLIQKFQRSVDLPTYWGAKEQALAELGYENAKDSKERESIEKEAIARAEQTVKDTQSSGLMGDLAKIQRGGPYAKLFTNFYSYFSATYQLNVEAFKKAHINKPDEMLALAGDLLIINAVPAIFAMILRETLKNECDMEIECLGEKLAEEQVSFILGMTIPTRELGTGIPALFGLDTFDYKGPSGLRPLADIYQLQVQAAQGEADKAFWKSLNKVAGAVLHYPAGQVNNTIEGIMAIENGEVEGFEMVGAVLAGPPR